MKSLQRVRPQARDGSIESGLPRLPEAHPESARTSLLSRASPGCEPSTSAATWRHCRDARSPSALQCANTAPWNLWRIAARKNAANGNGAGYPSSSAAHRGFAESPGRRRVRYLFETSMAWTDVLMRRLTAPDFTCSLTYLLRTAMSAAGVSFLTPNATSCCARGGVGWTVAAQSG